MFSLVDRKDQLILGNYISNFNPFVNHKLATYTTLCTRRQAGKASDKKIEKREKKYPALPCLNVVNTYKLRMFRCLV